MNKKGQLSVEFIIILVVILLYINTLIQPNIMLAEEVSKETFGLGQISLAANKIINTVDFVQLSGGETRQTIFVYIPKEGTLFCKGFDAAAADQNTISFDFTLTAGISHPSCSGDTCTKTLRTESRAGLDCQNFPAGGLEGPAQVSIQVYKQSTDPVEPLEIEIV